MEGEREKNRDKGYVLEQLQQEPTSRWTKFALHRCLLGFLLQLFLLRPLLHVTNTPALMYFCVTRHFLQGRSHCGLGKLDRGLVLTFKVCGNRSAEKQTRSLSLFFLCVCGEHMCNYIQRVVFFVF